MYLQLILLTIAIHHSFRVSFSQEEEDLSTVAVTPNLKKTFACPFTKYWEEFRSWKFQITLMPFLIREIR